MSRSQRWSRSAFSRLGISFVLTCGSLSAWGQASLSDAQVESNVLRAMAGAPELANEAITTRTIYGTVTLSGTVSNENVRRKAETLASTSVGVKKVVDELTLSSDPSGAPAPAADPHAGMVLQSDGTYAAAAGTTYQRNDPDNDQVLDQQAQAQTSAPLGGQPDGTAYPPTTAPSGGPNYGQTSQPPPPPGYPQTGYPPSGYPQSGYPAQSYPPSGGYPQRQQGAYGREPMYAAPMDGGQVAGQAVTVPQGTLVRVRINELLASNRSQPGDVFDGEVVHDVVAGDAIAIPRGASVQGRVVASKPSGVLKGRGEMTLELTSVTLAGHVYPVVSDQWVHNGGDKTIQTVNRTAGFGALGAIVGAVAGGGEGAAIGAGVGAAGGLGSSAASGRGQVVVPPEAVVTFHLAQPANVQTVSEQELQRLAYGTPVNGQRYARPRPYPSPYGYPPAYSTPY